MQADCVISNAHPAVTLSLVDDCPAIRKIYRRRIATLDNTDGMFTANIRLKPNALPYLNRNLFIHREGADLWQNPTDSMLVHFYPDEHALDILTPMRWEEVAPWADKPRGRRGDDYVAFKAQKTEAIAVEILLIGSGMVGKGSSIALVLSKISIHIVQRACIRITRHIVV